MSHTLARVKLLAAQRKVRVTLHAYQRMVKRDILPTEVIAGVSNAEVIEAYPDFHTGPAVLVLQFLAGGDPAHVVWGIERGTLEPAVVVTAYRPDSLEWSPDFKRRRS